MMSEAFTSIQNTVVENIKHQDVEEIRAAIHYNAKRSVQIATDLLENGSEGAKVAVLKDMLDRDGYRPADVVEHRLKMEGGLRVEIIRKMDNIDVPINVEFTDLNVIEGE